MLLYFAGVNTDSAHIALFAPGTTKMDISFVNDTSVINKMRELLEQHTTIPTQSYKCLYYTGTITRATIKEGIITRPLMMYSIFSHSDKFAVTTLCYNFITKRVIYLLSDIIRV